MKRLNAIAAMAIGLLVLSAGPVRGQGPYVRPQTGPLSRPALSPYLNLLRSGSPAVNYYGLVRPQQEFGNSIQEIQNEMHAPLTAQTSPNSGTNLPITGHPSRFFSHGSYFFSHLSSSAGNTRYTSPPTPGAVMARPGQPAMFPR